MITTNTNVNAMFGSRMLDATNKGMSNTLERLSSGLRINSAKDDASGLAISDRLTSQIRGLNQATRNINDAVSMLQTAEGAMQEITNLLQRGRELAVQAGNGAMAGSDRQALQAEVNQLKQEITRISEDTSFNGQFLLRSNATGGTDINQDKLDVQDGLRTGWLRNAEQMIIDYYGLTGNNGDMTVIYEDDSGDAMVAWVTNFFNTTTHEAVKQELHIDLSDFTPVTDENGGTAPQYNDRIIAHEMVHAVMGVTMNAESFNTWFHEGAAELIQGGDERVLGALQTRMAGGESLVTASNNLVASIGATGDTWAGTDQQVNERYAASYVAFRFLHDEIKAAGGTGIDELFGYLSANKDTETYDIDEGLNAIATAHAGFAYNSETAFRTAFVAANGAGSQYLQAMYNDGELHNTDTGAIGGLDADGGEIKTAESVVPNGAAYQVDPLVGFNTIWSEELTLSSASTVSLTFQTGANKNEGMAVMMRGMSAAALNVSDVDITTNYNQAITKFDRALGMVDEGRAYLGAQMNRLEHSMAVTMNSSENLSAARSRILDADIAFETAQLTKQSILQQASVSMIAQATTAPELALKLLG